MEGARRISGKGFRGTGSVVIGEGEALSLDPTGASTCDGDAAGAGSFVNSGAGDWTVRGDLFQAGGTPVSRGIVSGGDLAIGEGLVDDGAMTAGKDARVSTKGLSGEGSIAISSGREMRLSGSGDKGDPATAVCTEAEADCLRKALSGCLKRPAAAAVVRACSGVRAAA